MTPEQFIEARHARRMTQDDMAAALGCGRATVQRYEYGAVRIGRRVELALASIEPLPEREEFRARPRR